MENTNIEVIGFKEFKNCLNASINTKSEFMKLLIRDLFIL